MDHKSTTGGGKASPPEEPRHPAQKQLGQIESLIDLFLASTWPKRLILGGSIGLGIAGGAAGWFEALRLAAAVFIALSGTSVALGVVGLLRERARRSSRRLGADLWPPGPDPYQGGDGALFGQLGRGQELTTLRQAIQAGETRLITVTGPAGLGKTSLLQAGLQTTLGSTAVVTYWNGEKGRTNRSLRHAIESSVQGGSEKSRSLQAFALEGLGQPRVVVVDDFEKMDPDDSAALLVILRRILEADQVPPTTWVLAFDPHRAELWRRFEVALPRPLRARIQKCSLKSLPVAVAQECLLRLRDHYGLAVDNHVLQQLAQDLRSPDGVLPLCLGIAFMSLTQTLRHDGLREITTETYANLGGLTGLFKRYIDQSVTTEIAPVHRSELLKALAALVDARRGASLPHGRSLGDLTGKVALSSRHAVQEALANMAASRARILTAEACGPHICYRLADLGLGPALLQLAGLGEDEAKTVQRLIEIRCQNWHLLGKEESALLSAADLREWKRHRNRLSLGAQEIAYLNQSLRYRRFRQARAAAYALAALAVLAAAGIGIWKWRQWERFRFWGLPTDLGARQEQLRTLNLPGVVNDLSWLHRDLAGVRLSYTTLQDLRGLPEKLEQLDLCGATLLAPSTLPDGLRSLDARGVPPQKLGDLPAGLEALHLAGLDVTELRDLPAGLERLTLQQTELRTLAGIPDSVTYLHLSQGAFISLAGLPPQLDSLVLEATRIRNLADLPEHVRSLTLRKNPLNSGLSSLPPDLGSLTVEGGLVPAIVDLAKLPTSLGDLALEGVVLRSPELLATRFPSLRSLTLNVPSLEALPPLPPTLQTLTVISTPIEGFDRWPPQLTDLTLKLPESTVDPGALPASLRQLTLSVGALRYRRFPGALRQLEILSLSGSILRLLPASMTHLSAKWSSGSRLSTFPPHLEALSLYGSSSLQQISNLPASLRFLDLQGTRIATLAALPAGLRELNIAGAPIHDLSRLPPRLEVLHLKPGQVKRLGNLPTTVHTLHFAEDQTCGLYD